LTVSSARRDRFRNARRDPDLCVLEGLHALKHALRFAATVTEVVSRDLAALDALAQELAPDVAATIRRLATPVEAEEFNALAPLVHPTGVMAIAERRAESATAILARPDGAVIFLEDPVHLGNIGAAVRVAAAAGAAGLVASGRHDPWAPESVRAAAGLHFAVPVAHVAELPAVAGRLVAFTAEAPPLMEVEVPADAILAFGSERRGLSATLLARADLHASLPMQPGVSSLNLATAVAAVLYTLRACQSR
jgi:TrmH family RNA methyltransferase